MRRALVVAPVALAMPVLPAAPAGAETTVAHNGNVVTITVRVDVYGAEGLTGPDGTTPLIDYWEGTVNDTWGAAFNQSRYKDCFQFKLKLDLEARGRDADDREGRHRLHVTAARTGGDWDGVGWRGVPETSRDAATGDGTDSKVTINNDCLFANPERVEASPPTWAGHTCCRRPSPSPRPPRPSS